MTAAVAPSLISGIFQGRIAHTRFWLYVGLMAGALALAFFGGNGYDEDAYLQRLLSMQGVIWVGAGAILGVAASLFVGGSRSSGRGSPAVVSTVPWLD